MIGPQYPSLIGPKMQVLSNQTSNFRKGLMHIAQSLYIDNSCSEYRN